MSSFAVAIATAATQHEQDDLTLTISPVVFHKSMFNSVRLEPSTPVRWERQFGNDVSGVAQLLCALTVTR